LDTWPTATRNEFLADLGLTHETSRAAVVPKRAPARDGHWITGASSTLPLLQFEIPTGVALDTWPTATRNEFLADLGLTHETSLAAVVPNRASARDGHWITGASSAANACSSPRSLISQILILQVFATRLRDGRITPGCYSLGSRAVEDLSVNGADKYSLEVKPVQQERGYCM
jgi:hypothetical protein